MHEMVIQVHQNAYTPIYLPAPRSMHVLIDENLTSPRECTHFYTTDAGHQKGQNLGLVTILQVCESVPFSAYPPKFTNTPILKFS